MHRQRTIATTPKPSSNYKGGKISGSWLETTFDASGNVSGSAIGHLVHARISGDKFSGRMSINVSDAGHTINIVQLDNKSGAYHLAASFDAPSVRRPRRNAKALKALALAVAHRSAPK